MKNICCFAGHSNLSHNYEKVFEAVCASLLTLIREEDVNEFWVGNYGEFDKLCASAVRKLKKEFPHIQIHLVIPYLKKEINEYKEFYYKNYDSIIMADIPLNTPHPYKIVKCNEYMVKSSSHMICYIAHTWGGAYETYKYASNKDIKITKIL